MAWAEAIPALLDEGPQHLVIDFEERLAAIHAGETANSIGAGPD
jgi:hypothetical protein